MIDGSQNIYYKKYFFIRKFHLFILMGEDKVSLIVKDLVEGLPKETPRVIYITGGDEILRKDVMNGIASSVRTIVTDSLSLESDYNINLTNFIRKYAY